MSAIPPERHSFTFGAWLRAQIDRPDVVGDAARRCAHRPVTCIGDAAGDDNVLVQLLLDDWLTTITAASEHLEGLS